MANGSLPLVLIVVLWFTVFQYSNAVTCFGINGLAYPENIICPGSNACCGSAATCLPNRLCHNAGQNNNTFVRGPCAKRPYDPATCANICLYNETTGFLPRINVCADGSLCCDGSPNCCENGQGIFLDSTGGIAFSLLPISTSTSILSTLSSIPSATSIYSAISSMVVASSDTTSSLTSPASATITSASKVASSSGLSTGAKASLGIGVTFGFLIITGLVALLWVQQRIIRKDDNSVQSAAYNKPRYFDAQQLAAYQMSPKELESRLEPQFAELPAHHGYQEQNR